MKPRQRRAATPPAFDALLAWLDQGTDSAGEKYVEIRRRLVSYFARKRCPWADDLADETLSRVARRLQEEGRITDAAPVQYCYIVARFVFLEYLRHPEYRGQPLDGEMGSAADVWEPGWERLLDSLDQCLGELPAAGRDLILAYYRGDQGARTASRRALAQQLGLTPNALSIRACRIRALLEACVRRRMEP